MNLGIRDGIECGKAIAQHILADYGTQPATSKAKAKTQREAPLEKYAVARRKEAVEVVGMTKMLSWFAALPPDSFAARMRDTFAWLAGRGVLVKRQFVWNISGLGRD